MRQCAENHTPCGMFLINPGQEIYNEAVEEDLYTLKFEVLCVIRQ